MPTARIAEMRLSPVARYATAAGAMVLALLLREVLVPWVGLGYPFSSLFGAVAIGVWIGGWKPALVATLVGYAVAVLYFVEPVGTLSLATPGDVFGTVMFWISCALIIGLGEAMRRA